jgi:hypothetical protein
MLGIRYAMSSTNILDYVPAPSTSHVIAVVTGQIKHHNHYPVGSCALLFEFIGQFNNI